MPQALRRQGRLELRLTVNPAPRIPQALRRQERLQAVDQRQRDADDAKLLRCGYCDALGHNRRTCPVLKVRNSPPARLRLLHQAALAGPCNPSIASSGKGHPRARTCAIITLSQEDEAAIGQQGAEWQGEDQQRPGLRPLGASAPVAAPRPPPLPQADPPSMQPVPIGLQQQQQQQWQQQEEQLRQQQQREQEQLRERQQRQQEQLRQRQQQQDNLSQPQPQPQPLTPSVQQQLPPPAVATVPDAPSVATLPLRMEDEGAQVRVAAV